MAELTNHDTRSFAQNYSSGPITALAVVFHKVIAGCGNQLLIYDLKHLQLETRIEVLEGASVHGICTGPLKTTNEQLLCVYGDRETCIVGLKNGGDVSECIILTPSVHRVNDWIWAAQWLKQKDESQSIALALAHNTVALWDWKTGKSSIVRHCVENCILYCAHFIGETWETLVLAAGTVFNQVVLWPVGDLGKPAISDEAVPLIHSLSGHKGVIFSIRYHAEHKKLCSLSDDRSIQVWQFNFPSSTSTSMPSVEDWRHMESVLLFTLFGHTARVWDAVLLRECFASVGEDATCYIWNYDGKIISKFKGHKGRNIWSIAATEDENFLITGGGDSSIRMWELQTVESSLSSPQHIVDVPLDLTSVQDGDFIRVVALLSFDILVVMMNSGCFSSFCLTAGTWDHLFNDERFTSYSVVSSCPDQQKVAVGSITGVIKILSLTDNRPAEMSQIEHAVFDGKVMGITWMTEETLLVSGPEGKCLILTVTMDQEHCKSCLQITPNIQLFLPSSKHRWITTACSVQLDSQEMVVCGNKDGTIHCYVCSHNDFKSVQKQYSMMIQPCQTFHHVHGKAGVTSICLKDGLVYSTGRDGHYRQWELKEDKLILRYGVKVTKGFDWIDRLEWRDDDMLIYGFLSSYFVVWSVSCNQQVMAIHCGGGHRSWGCCHQDDTLRFTFLKSGKISVVDSQHYSKQRLIKPPLHGRQLCDVKLITQIDTRNDWPTFLVCTASEDTTINIGLLSDEMGITSWKPMLNLKGHLSSVRCIAVSYLCQEEERSYEIITSDSCAPTVKDSQEIPHSKNYIIFTGGGRAEIRVWKLCLSNEKRIIASEKETAEKSSSALMEVVDTDNVRSYPKGRNCKETVSPRSTYSLKLNGNEEEALIGCTYEEFSIHFLGESRHKKRYSNWKSQKLRLDPETRVMSLAATRLSSLGPYLTSHDKTQSHHDIHRSLENLHILSVAGSDGVLRVFSYNDSSRQLHPVAQSSIHKGCVLKVMHFINNTTDANCAFYLFSTSTNGCILIWSLLDVAEKIVKSLVEKRPIKLTERPKRDEIHDEINSKDSVALTAGTLSDADARSSVNETKDSADEYDDDVNDSDIDEEYTDFSVLKEKSERPQSEVWQPISELKSHQSGVNSISACHFKDDIHLLASGGDDNALVFQMVQIKDSNVIVLSKTMKPDAHAAQITGVWMVSPTIAVSASIDQRICVWNLDIQASQMNLSLLKCKYIHIADVSSTDVYLHRGSLYLLIGGEGMCLYSFK